jgi:glycosyltransferase involved in cell wall biosynthesis
LTRVSSVACEAPASRRDRVLIVGNFLSADRITRFVCEDLAARLSAGGWEVLTASAKVNRARRVFDMAATAWSRRRDYAVAQIDVYSGPAFLWAEVVCWVLRRARKPYVLTLHGGQLPEFAARWPNRVRRLLRSAAAVTSPSRYLRERLEPLGVTIRLLPNPIEADRYPFRERGPVRPQLVWLRAFHRIYNPTLGPRVLSMLALDFPEARLRMIGPDKGDGSRDDTRRAAADLGVSDRIEFTGGVAKTDVPAALSRGDVFLNTTNVDNTPVSVLEAMACGLCVVSTNVGGLPYLLDDGTTALLVPPGDAAAMADAVRRLLGDPELARRLSRNGRAMAETFAWGVILPKWESLLRDAAHRMAGAPPLSGVPQASDGTL